MKSRKQIELPCGAVCKVRKFSMFDFRKIGSVPQSFIVDDGKGGKADAADDYQTRLARVAMVECCSPLLYKDGNKIKIVDKPFHDCEDDETSVDEVDTQDALAIVQAVCELSGFGKEAAVAAEPFPERQEAASGH